LVGYQVLLRLARAGRFPLPPEQVANLLTWLIVGVILGGRLGYATFYEQDLWENPLRLLQIWHGGLSFHGGLLGVVVVGIVWARRWRAPVLALGDAFVLGITPGILAVRLSNFIKGELFGRACGPSALFGMRFPTDPDAERLLQLWKPLGHTGSFSVRDVELRYLEAHSLRYWDAIKGEVPLRHPSQLYEALGEGLLLGLVLLILYVWWRRRSSKLGNGILFGIFLLGYGSVRFVIEFYRQPDSQFVRPGNELGTVLAGFSMGQLLCSIMIALGLWFIARACRHPQEATRRGSLWWRSPEGGTVR
ncbi:MAG: prolipoprotein diacylglyceryl transferase, partial [Planctomycetota bacterium]